MEGHVIFNAVVYSVVIAYILYINFAAYYNKTTNELNSIVKVFENWIFRLVYLLFVGFFALDLFPWGGFTLAILLTIAFLNTNMLVYKKRIDESFSNQMDQYENFSQEQEQEQDEQGKKANCGPYAPNYRLPFNPSAYRPDDQVMASGFPDNLPKDSKYDGPYTQSGVAYDFNMA